MMSVQPVFKKLKLVENIPMRFDLLSFNKTQHCASKRKII